MATFSTTEAAKSLDEEIKKTEKELNELNAAISAFPTPDEADDRLRIEQARKESELDELRREKIVLDSMAASSSYRGKEPSGILSRINLVHARDERIAKTNSDLAAAQARLAAIPEGVSNFYVLEERRRTNIKIKNLQARKGKIEERQKKIVNKKLQRQLKRLAARARTDGTYNASVELQSKYETLRTRNVLDASTAIYNKKYLKAVAPGTRAIASFIRIKGFDLYFKSLRIKPGIVRGFNRLSSKFYRWLRSKRIQLQMWLNDQLGTTGRSR